MKKITALLASAALVLACQEPVRPQAASRPSFQLGWEGGLGSKIAFSRLKETPESDEFLEAEIWVMNADGTEPRRLTHNTTFDLGAEWSPNGQKIAFHGAQFVGGVGVSLSIFLINADGSGQTELTGTCGQFPSWSPDGKTIAFNTVAGCPVPGEIFVINADGSGLTNLTNHPAGDARAAWSPNGRQIAFNSNRDGDGEIWVMNANGSDPVQLTFNSATDQAPDWSPDGRKIVFQSNRDDPRFDLYVMNADGTDVTRLTFGGGRDLDPSWSPDGRQIAFDSDREFVAEEIRQVFVMNADGTDQRPVTGLPSENGHAGWGPGHARLP
jgi:Tol biopolymer transport system component